MSGTADRADTQNAILEASRRRCCICHGLNGDLATKRGQLAHLDRNAANFDAGNLAFICLDHHDWYDARPGHGRTLTIGEVRYFQGELQAALHDVPATDEILPQLFEECPLVQWNRPPASYPEFVTVGSLPHTGQRVYLTDSPQLIVDSLKRVPAAGREDFADQTYSGRWVKWAGTVVAIRDGKQGCAVQVDTDPAVGQPLEVLLAFPVSWRPDIEPLRIRDYILFEGLIRGAGEVIELVFPSISKLMRPAA